MGRDPVAQAEERRLVQQRLDQVAAHRGDEEMGAVRADVDRCRDDGRRQRDDLGGGFGPRLELCLCFGDRLDDRRRLGDDEQRSGVVVRHDLDGLDDEGRGGGVLERLRVGLDGRFGLTPRPRAQLRAASVGVAEVRLGPRGGRFRLDRRAGGGRRRAEVDDAGGGASAVGGLVHRSAVSSSSSRSSARPAASATPDAPAATAPPATSPRRRAVPRRTRPPRAAPRPGRPRRPLRRPAARA